MRALQRDRGAYALHSAPASPCSGGGHDRRHQICQIKSGGVAATFFGDLVVVAAFQGYPVGLEVLRARQKVRPSVARDQALGLPNHVELAIAANFTNEYRFG